MNLLRLFSSPHIISLWCMKKYHLFYLFTFNQTVLKNNAEQNVASWKNELSFFAFNSFLFFISISVIKLLLLIVPWVFGWPTDLKKSVGCMISGPNARFEFGRRYECIRSLKHHKRKKYLKQIGLYYSVLCLI